MSRGEVRELHARIVRVTRLCIGRPVRGRRRARVVGVLGHTVCVRRLGEEPVGERLLQRAGQVVRVPGVRVADDVRRVDVAVDAIVARSPARTFVGSSKSGVGRREIRVDVVRPVRFLAVQCLERTDEAPGQSTIDGDVRAPHLRKLVVRRRDVQLVGRRRRAGHGGGLVRVRVRIERTRGRIVALIEAGQHTRLAKLVGDPDIRRSSAEDAGATADGRTTIALDVPVEAHARRNEKVGVRQLAGVVPGCSAGLVAKRQAIGLCVVERRVLEDRQVDTQTRGDPEGARGTPFILRVSAVGVDTQRLDRRVETRDVVVPDLEATERHRRSRTRRIGEEAVGVGVEIRERVVHVGALQPGREAVVGPIALRRHTEGQVVLVGVNGEVVLKLQRVVPQHVVGRERLEPERQVVRTVVVDVYQREKRTLRLAAFVIRGVARDDLVRHVRTDLRVQFADVRGRVFPDRVAGILKTHGVQIITTGAQRAERLRVRNWHIRLGLEIGETKTELVVVVHVPVDLGNDTGRRHRQIEALRRTGLVVELVLQKGAERGDVGLQHPRRVADDRLSSGVGLKAGGRLRQLVRLVIHEEEQRVLDERTAHVTARLRELELALVEEHTGYAVAHQPLIARGVVERSLELVAAALGHRIHAGAGKAALAHIERCDVDLYLLDRVDRNWRHTRAGTRL